MSASTPKVRSIVAVTFFDGAHMLHTTIAHVLSVGAVDETGEPQLTVAYPDPAADPVVLSSANWERGYRRVTSVKHFSHPAVSAGQESIAWGSEDDTAPVIPQPAGDAERPYFTRQDDPPQLQVSTEQAAAVQSGKAPLPTTQTPLLNEPEPEPEPVAEPKALNKKK